METLFIITPIITLASTTLSIILFFKIWIMTNDVIRIKNKVDSSSCLRDLNPLYKAMALNDPNISALLFDAMFDDFCFIIKNGWDENDASIIRNKYKALYAKAGVDMPSEFVDMSIKCFREKYQ